MPSLGRPSTSGSCWSGLLPQSPGLPSLELSSTPRESTAWHHIPQHGYKSFLKGTHEASPPHCRISQGEFAKLRRPRHRMYPPETIRCGCLKPTTFVPVEREDMSCSTRGDVFLWGKRTCLLAQQEEMVSVPTRRHNFLLNRRRVFLISKMTCEDVSSF